jgi:hypothetical protein
MPDEGINFMKRFRQFFITLTLLLINLLLLGTFLPIQKVTAVPSPLLLPFPIGETWYVCQGYNGSFSHRNLYALDLSVDPNSPGGSGCNMSTKNASTGRTVVAPGTGTAYRSSDGVFINFDAGGSIIIGHITPTKLGRVTAGETIGTVNAPNVGNNGGYAHIHISVSRDHGTRNQIPFDEANGARFQCAPDMPSSGAVNQHSGTALTRCDPSIPSYQGQFVSQNYQGTMVAGSTQRVQVLLKNTGRNAWDGNTKIYALPRDTNSPFYDSSWLHPYRIATTGVVQPGAVGTFEFTLRAPTTPGQYRIDFGFIQEMSMWFNEPAEGSIWFPITVTAATPTTPSNFRVSVREPHALMLNWSDNASNEDGYRIYRWNGSNWPLHATLGPNTTLFIDENLLCNQGYAYRLSAFNNAGESFVDGWLDGSTTECSQPPSKPANLQVTPLDTDKLQLSWQDTSNNEAGFHVYKWGAQGDRWDFFLAFSVGANSTTAIDSGLNCGWDYYYKISAFNAQGESSATDYVVGRVGGCPAEPTNLRLIETGVDYTLIAWDDRTTNEQGFHIYRWRDGENGFDFYYHASVGMNNPSFKDTVVTCDVDYYYLVSAYNGYGESRRVGWVQGRTKPCPATATPTATATTNPDEPTVVPQPTATSTTQPSPTTTNMPVEPTEKLIPPTSTATMQPVATQTTMPTPYLPDPTTTSTVPAQPTTQYTIFLPLAIR